MESATVADALAHPTWRMGEKITIDSATMMNKALEIIEAHELFAMPAEKIDVLIHPQSIVHSMIEYADGSVLAQMGASDMRTPIAHTLGWPDRIASPGRKLDLAAIGSFSFEAVDPARFPSIGLAYEALKAGLAARIAFNAANEVAVASFLSHKISYLDIVAVVKDVMDQTTGLAAPQTLEDVFTIDQAMREMARSCIVGGNQPVRKVI